MGAATRRHERRIVAQPVPSVALRPGPSHDVAHLEFPASSLEAGAPAGRQGRGDLADFVVLDLLFCCADKRRLAEMNGDCRLSIVDC